MTEASPRALEFADRLRQTRLAISPKVTGQRLAELLEWRPMKVSLIERGKQLITEPELDAWARVLDVSEDVRAELLAELRAIRLDQARWRDRLRASGHEGTQKSFAELERDAHKIVNVETGVAPGHGQTPGYARIMFEKSAALKGAGTDVDAAVAARMQRQQILYDGTKTIELLVLEACLHGGVATGGTLVGQIDRLIALTHLPGVRVGIVPLRAELAFPLLHGFWLFDDELALVEVLHTEMTTRDPDDVQLYRDTVADLWRVAAEGDAARSLLQQVLRTLNPDN